MLSVDVQKLLLLFLSCFSCCISYVGPLLIYSCCCFIVVLNIRDEPVDQAHSAGPFQVNLVVVAVVVSVVLSILAHHRAKIVVVC